MFYSYLFCYRRNIDSQKEFEDSIKRLTNSENDTVRPRTLIIMQRNLTFQRVCGQVLDASFKELCDRVRYNTFLGIIYSFYILIIMLFSL